MNKLLRLVFLLSALVLSHASTAQTWIQRGNDIEGEADNDESGKSVSMPDPYTLAIGAFINDGNGTTSGHVRIYRWNGSSWVQKGSDIDGEATYDQSGLSVCMPDSNTVAIGANYNDGNGSNSGHVRIYSWNGNSWIQMGADIDGEASSDQSGWSVSMPDSITIAIGAIWNDGGGSNAGHVRIYRWDGSSWTQKGSDIDGEASGDQSGYSVSMPDSNTVAIGANYNDGNGTNSGHVRVYSWVGGSWVQKGLDIDGEAPNDQSGCSVSMPDSNTVAIGARDNDENGSNSGHVRIYRWNGNNWVQKGNDINGEAADNASGWSVNMPDTNTIAVGAPYNKGFATNAGHVRVFKWNGTDWTQIGSDIDGKAALEYSGWSVSMPDSATVAIGAPDADGILTNAGIVRIYKLCTNTESAITTTACNSYTAPDGQVYTTSGIKTAVIPNAAGCDSTITIDLTVNHSTASSITATACDSYTAPDGQVYTTSGIKTAVIPNAAGCDSTITIDLTVNHTTASSITATACNSYTAPDGQVYTTSGIKTAVIPNAAGCDSTITIDLTVNHSTASSITVTACDSYTAPDGQFYTTSGIKTAVIPNAAGCDSTITIDLTVNNVDVSVTQNENTLTANTAGAIYQWLDCNNGYSVIDGETNQTFIATQNGSYAVKITLNSCTDTSNCYPVTSVSVFGNTLCDDISVFPNPTNGIVNFDFSDIEVYKISITDTNGKVVFVKDVTNGVEKVDFSKFPNGIYLIQLHTNKKTFTVKILKE